MEGQGPSQVPFRDEAAEVDPEVQREQGPAKVREPYWDNVKAVCVLLVVVTHTTILGVMQVSKAALGDNEKMQADLTRILGRGPLAAISGLFFCLSPMVMPGFCFVSGHLSSSTLTRRRIKHLAQMTMIVVIFTVLNAIPTDLATKEMPIGLWNMPGVQWFLFALIVWRAILPLLAMLRRPLLLSVILGTVAVVTDDTNFYFHSCLTFLPFFVAGFQTKRETLKQWRKPAIQISFAITLPLAVVLVGPLLGNLGMNPYTCFNSTGPLCVSWQSIPLHLLYYVVSAPLILSFLAVIPERKIWGLTRAGQTSMYIYLLHMYLVLPTSALLVNLQGWALIAAFIGVAFTAWAILGTGCARICCRTCVEPRVDCCFLAGVFAEEEGAPTPPPCGIDSASTATEKEGVPTASPRGMDSESTATISNA